MNRLVAFLALFAVVASVSAQSQNFSCSYTDTNGCYYDLTSLTVPVTSDTFYQYTVLTGEGQGAYEANVCGALNPTIVNGTTGVAVTQTVNGTTYSCGTLATIGFNTYSGAVVADTVCQGVEITYSDGTLCPVAGVNRVTTLNVGCNANYSAAQLVDANEDDSCSYRLQMYSSAACGQQLNATATVSSSLTPVVTPDNGTSSQSTSPSISASYSETFSASVSGADSQSLSLTLSVSASVTAAGSVDNSSSSSPSLTSSDSMSVSITQSLTVTATAKETLSVGAPPYETVTPSVTPSASSDDGNGWIWWVVGAVAIVLIIVAVAVAGFIVYKKKQQSYDSIGYE